MSDQTLRPETLALHAGQRRTPPRKPAPSPSTTTSYVFDDAAHAAHLFALQEFGNIYTRIMNPTTDVFEKRVAALEGGVGGARGRVRPGGRDARDPQHRRSRRQHRLQRSLYGGTYNLFAYTLPQLGITTHFVDGRRPRPTSRPPSTTRPGRSTSRPSATRGSTCPTSGDRGRGARARHPAHRRQHLRRRYLARPIEHGADIVVHSATKWIGGHGTAIGGVMVDAGLSTGPPPRASPSSSSPTRLPRGRATQTPSAPLAYILKLRVQLPPRPRGLPSARSTRSSCCRGLRRCRSASSATARTPSPSPAGSTPTRGRLGLLSRPRRSTPTHALARVPARRLRRHHHLRRQGRLRGRPAPDRRA